MNKRRSKGETLSEKILLGFVRLAEYLKREQAAVFKRYGVTFPQYNVLRVLDSSDEGRNTLSNVSRTMLVGASNLSGLVKRLERKGFIVRKGHPNDERVTIVEITKKGRQTLKSLDKDKDKDLERILAPMSEEERLFILTKIKQTLKRSE
jgi:DNA-binding MarR family transcriptional regulator